MPLLKLMLILEREDWGLARRLCMGTRNIYVFLQISKNIEGLFTLVKFVYPWSAVLIQNMLLVLLRMRPIFWKLRMREAGERGCFWDWECVASDFQQYWRLFHIGYISLSLTNTYWEYVADAVEADFEKRRLRMREERQRLCIGTEYLPS